LLALLLLLCEESLMTDDSGLLLSLRLLLPIL